MRIAVTQRVEMVPSHGERRDCLDQRWAGLLENRGLDMVLVPNAVKDVRGWAERQGAGGLLLTGGNDLAHLPDLTNPAPERDATESTLLGWAASDRLPVLGVCRGMQMINHFLGGTLARVPGHVARRHRIRGSADSALFAPYSEVNSFHGWGIAAAGLASDLVALAWSEDGFVEAFRHRHLPWVGIMWHPEREEPGSDLDARLIDATFGSSRRTPK